MVKYLRLCLKSELTENRNVKLTHFFNANEI